MFKWSALQSFTIFGLSTWTRQTDYVKMTQLEMLKDVTETDFVVSLEQTFSNGALSSCFVCLHKINFILFISIIRILVQKLRCTDVGGNERSQYRYAPRAQGHILPLTFH